MIVVVGAGLVGLAIADELASRGADVRVLDAREPASGASWAGAGMLAPYTEDARGDDVAFEAFCVDSLRRYPAFVADLRERTGVDARLRLDGIVEAAFDEPGVSRLRARVAALAARGVDATWLSADEARAAEPAFGPRVFGAARVAGEGAVDNRRLGRALVAACVARGVRIDGDAGPIALECDARRVLGVRGPTGFVPADVVVNAAGAWAGDFGGVPPEARVPVAPVKGEMLALAVPRGLVRRVTWVPGAYLVPRDDGRLLVGATVERAAYDTRTTARGTHALLDAALRAIPSLGDAAISETWAGLRPGTPDGLPFLGATRLGGYVVATGHYRNGILLTPATAVAIADVVLGPATDALRAFSPLRGQEAAVAFAKGPR